MNPSQFKKLQAKWYKKLKQNGFDDVELNEYDLKVPSGTFRDNSRNGNENPLTREAKQTYYQLANQFLSEHIFENKRDKIIWEYHSNGMSIRNIVKTLKKVRIKTYRRAVWETVAKLRKIMKEKYLVNG